MTVFGQTRHYVTALIALTAMSLAYQLVVTPALQAPAVTPVEPKTVTEISDMYESLADLFPRDAWQCSGCKHLQSSGGMLLFQELEQISDNQWKLSPVTVVIGRGMSANPTPNPVIIDAPDGAEITFTESLDVMSGSAPPIRRGRMIGQVSIRRRGDRNDRDTLQVRTSNVGIDDRKIWTTEPIEMEIGKARLSGRDLTLHFANLATSPGSPAVLDRMELIYLNQLIMPLENGGLLSATDSRRDKSAIRAELSVFCGGRLEYDFAIDQLSMRDSVSLVHQLQGQPADYFECDVLNLKLRDPTNDAMIRNSPLDWLSKIVATGSPARAVLPSFDAELDADVIDLDALTGLVRAQGKRAQENGRTVARAVRIRRGGIEALLSQLIYQFDPDQPDAIGMVDVQGAGIVTVTDPESPLVRARWRDGFKLQPTSITTAKDFDSNVELLIDGDVEAQLSDGGTFNAESVAGLLRPISELDAKTGRRKTTLVPSWFEARQGVSIDTSALAAKTQQLELFFLPPTAGQSSPQHSPHGETDHPLRQWVSQPGADAQTNALVARPRPVIHGDSIRAQLRLDSAGVSARDMSVIGGIKVTHLMKAGEQMLPATLTGQTLRLVDDGGGDDVLQLTGRDQVPARFELGDGFFVGPMIQIRPSDNHIWMDAAGEFRLPTAALPTSFSGRADDKIHWMSAPHCRWQGEMVFDGHTAVLTGGVEITAAMVSGTDHWELLLKGDRLQVELRGDVEVRDIDSLKNASIGRISLLQSESRPVLVQALRRAGDGVLEAKHLMHAEKVTLVPGEPEAGTEAIQSGRLIGEGPGWYRGWMIPSAGTNPFALAKDESANPNQSTLTGIHLIFQHAMQGNFAAQSLEFFRGVRVGVRPVDGWDDLVDATAMDAISLGESTLDCDRLRFMVAPGWQDRIAGQPVPWEMEALSGVVFRTRSERGLVEAMASRAAYASAKDLFTVEGSPKRAAIFRRTLPDGRPGIEGAVKSMTLRPSTMEIQDSKWERLNLATPASSGLR